VDSLLVILQDNVPAFESSEAVAIIERNLGGKLLDNYESFDMQPIAAASLGQVIASGSLLTAAAACRVLIAVCHGKGRNKLCLLALMKEHPEGDVYWTSLWTVCCAAVDVQSHVCTAGLLLYTICCGSAICSSVGSLCFASSHQRDVLGIMAWEAASIMHDIVQYA